MEERLVCSLCYPDAEEIGEIFEEFYLLKYQGDFVIAWGYHGEPIIIFPEKPEVEPKDDDSWIQWATQVNLITDDWKFDIQTGYTIRRACNKAGHRPDRQGYTDMWIYNRAAKMIKAWEEGKS